VAAAKSVYGGLEECASGGEEKDLTQNPQRKSAEVTEKEKK
jgi:hypothetical protein